MFRGGFILSVEYLYTLGKVRPGEPVFNPSSTEEWEDSMFDVETDDLNLKCERALMFLLITCG